MSSSEKQNWFLDFKSVECNAVNYFLFVDKPGLFGNVWTKTMMQGIISTNLCMQLRELIPLFSVVGIIYT